jgi:hypothetical protein
MNRSLRFLCAAIFVPLHSYAFCGFYIAKADSKLFNRASQVVLARDGNHTVLTMANDYQGAPKDFAIVIPVPTVIKKEAVKIVEKAAIDHLDAYSAPRLVEYFDSEASHRGVLAGAVTLERGRFFEKRDLEFRFLASRRSSDVRGGMAVP